MGTIFDYSASKLINKAAESLKSIKEIKSPDWASFVRTGRAKERPPADVDWWYKRSAAILRKIYLYGPIGVSKLRVKFGSRKNRGVKPENFYPASGNHIRKMLQQLQKAGLIEESKKLKKGRIITAKGKSFLDKLAKD